MALSVESIDRNFSFDSEVVGAKVTNFQKAG